MIGFSRGAFIARCIADLVYKVGILTKFGIYYARDIYDMWREAGESGRSTPFCPSSPSDGSEDQRTLIVDESPVENESISVDRRLSRSELRQKIQEGDKTMVRTKISIEVCAVWDTVAALGSIVSKLGFLRPRSTKKLGFIHSDFNPGIINAFQALSLHDRRRSFLPLIWKRKLDDGPTNSAAQRLEQCWFMGYHSDIGGGTHGEGLAHFPLAWMLARLSRFVDMDFDNFWRPHLGISNWRIIDDGKSWFLSVRYRLETRSVGQSYISFRVAPFMQSYLLQLTNL